MTAQSTWLVSMLSAKILALELVESMLNVLWIDTIPSVVVLQDTLEILLIGAS